MFDKRKGVFGQSWRKKRALLSLIIYTLSTWGFNFIFDLYNKIIRSKFEEFRVVIDFVKLMLLKKKKI